MDNKKIKILIILTLGITTSLVIGFQILKKANIMGLENEEVIDYSKYFNEKYRWYKNKKTKDLLNKFKAKFSGFTKRLLLLGKSLFVGVGKSGNLPPRPTKLKFSGQFLKQVFLL